MINNELLGLFLDSSQRIAILVTLAMLLSLINCRFIINININININNNDNINLFNRMIFKDC